MLRFLIKLFSIIYIFIIKYNKILITNGLYTFIWIYVLERYYPHLLLKLFTKREQEIPMYTGTIIK